MNQKSRIMLIDDDRSLHVAMRHLFEGAGYQFFGSFSGEEGMKLLVEEKPDIVLLDVMMPGMNGFEVCHSIRGEGYRMPIIFLSAKGDIVDKGIGYTAGADDYVVKPFSSEELLLRIGALLRREKDNLTFAKATARNGNAVIGDLDIRFGSYEVLLRGTPVDLTAKEFEILALLASNPGQVFTREQIFKHIWGEDAHVDESSITMFMHKIREKIEDDLASPKYLLTVWRVGYKFADHI